MSNFAQRMEERKKKGLQGFNFQEKLNKAKEMLANEGLVPNGVYKVKLTDVKNEGKENEKGNLLISLGFTVIEREGFENYKGAIIWKNYFINEGNIEFVIKDYLKLGGKEEEAEKLDFEKFKGEEIRIQVTKKEPNEEGKVFPEITIFKNSNKTKVVGEVEEVEEEVEEVNEEIKVVEETKVEEEIPFDIDDDEAPFDGISYTTTETF